MHSVSRKHKVNTSIHIEAELVAADDVSVYILWKVLFIEGNGKILIIAYCINTASL